MDYKLNKEIREDRDLRASFNELAEKTFGLNFEGWYEAGYWTDRYIPYCLLDGNRVVACVAVSRMSMSRGERQKEFVQLGTVMTDAAYRGTGLSRFLMETALSDWKGRCDGMYLYANDSVLNFYPKFGFCPETEYRYRIGLSRLLSVGAKGGTGAGNAGSADFGLKGMETGGGVSARKLSMDEPSHRELLLRCFAASNPYSALSMTDNPGLLMFYCAGPMADCVYYCDEAGAAVVGEWASGEFTCFDIYGDGGMPMERLIAAAAGSAAGKMAGNAGTDMADGGAASVVLGFTPKVAEGWTAEPAREEDTTLFVLADGENPFAAGRAMFPALSHA